MVRERKVLVGISAAETPWQCIPRSWRVSPVLLQPLLLVSCLDLLVRAPGQLSCSAVYKQLCIPKFSRIYNVTAPRESPVLPLNSQTSPSKSRSCHSPRQKATSLRWRRAIKYPMAPLWCGGQCWFSPHCRGRCGGSMACRTTAPTSLMALSGHSSGQEGGEGEWSIPEWRQGAEVALREVLWWVWWWLELKAVFVVSAMWAEQQRVYSSSEGSLGTSPLLTLQWVQQNVNSLLLPPCFGVAGEALKVSAGKGLLQKPFFFPKIIPPSSCPKQTVLGAWRHCWAVQQEQSWPLRCVDAPCFSAFGFCQCPCA